MIDCKTNNLEISDANNNLFDYCRSNKPQSYSFVSQKPSWVRIRKSKICLFCSAPISYSFQLLNVMPTITTNKPTTLTNTNFNNITDKGM